MKHVKKKIRDEGTMAKSAMPEQCGLLRTIQMVVSGYDRRTCSKTFNPRVVIQAVACGCRKTES